MPSLTGPLETVTTDQEKTRRQTTIASDEELLGQDSKLSGTYYAKVREVRKHPTVKIARQLCVAPLLTSDWGYEATDEAPPDALEFIRNAINPIKNHLLRTSLFGCMDFGFQPYEKVFTLDPATNKITYKKLKPLLQDNTKILVELTTGAFTGLRQETEPIVSLELHESLLVYFDVEGTNWYGTPIMDAVLLPYEWWSYANDSNIRFDRKIAGAHWLIQYPPGATEIDGVKTDNFELARKMLVSLQSSGGIVVPKAVASLVDGMNTAGDKDLWNISIVGAYPTSNISFLDRLKYCDSLMARAFGLPERAILEGQFGTKAEAEAHADFAIANMELRHREMVQIYNWHCVNQLLRLNWGPQYENTVKITTAPIVGLALQYLRSIYQQFIMSPMGGAEAENIDFQNIRDQLEVPTLSLEARAALDATEGSRDLATFNTAVQ